MLVAIAVRVMGSMRRCEGLLFLFNANYEEMVRMYGLFLQVVDNGGSRSILMFLS